MSSAPWRKASTPAFWLIDEAHIMQYWWIFIMASISALGAQANPSRKPVMDQALEKPLRNIVRARIPGCDTIETRSPS